MERITEQNLKDLKFDGIIVGVPRNIKPGQHDDLCFIFECAYYSQGKHGYPEEGTNPDESSFYSAWYNDKDYLPNGLVFNSTSRFTLEHSFKFRTYDYYKFKNLYEFCSWYTIQCNYVSTSSYITVGNSHEYKPSQYYKFKTNTDGSIELEGLFKATRREKLADVIKLIDYKLTLEQLGYDLQALEEKNKIEAYKFIKNEYTKIEKEMNKFLDEEIV